MVSTTSKLVGAAALVVAAIQYVVLEAVTASAWDNPTYSYAHNNISDLGVPSCGGKVDDRVICSPWHTVMNTSFIVQGLLFLLAAVLLYRLLPGRRQWIYLTLGIIHGIGFTLVGLVHGSPEAGLSGALAWHIFGAALLIFSGNLTAIFIGTRLRPTHPRLAFTGITLGALGLLSLVIMGGLSGHRIASAFERGSVYPFILAELIAGIALLSIRRPAPKATEPTPADVTS